MKNEKIYDGITDIRDEIIEKAESCNLRKASRKKWRLGAVATILAVVFIVGAVLWSYEKPVAMPAFAVAQAQYPKMAPYPNERAYIKRNGDFDSEGFSKVYNAWNASRQAQRREKGYADGLESFFVTSTRQFLSNTNGENRVYSPLNVYMALGMLAELTDSGSRQQILDLLGSESIETLRAQASDLWNANYCQDGAVSSVLASSLWLSEDISFVQSTMDTLADTYYASSYQGKMGSDAFNQALQDWLNTQTGGLLEEQAGQVALSPDTVLALATTVYFQAKWSGGFSENNTKAGVFHAASGDVTADFMHQGGTDTFFWADQFGAVAQDLEGSGKMWFILPDEGVLPEDLLNDDTVMHLIENPYDWENQKRLIINKALPKFDVTSQMDLCTGLKELGITDVFDPAVSDFSPTTEDTDALYLSGAQHDTRVAIDEEGVTAIAYTAMMVCGAAEPPEDEMDFVLDRPFLFVITSSDALPLFVGIVNQPTQ